MPYELTIDSTGSVIYQGNAKHKSKLPAVDFDRLVAEVIGSGFFSSTDPNCGNVIDDDSRLELSIQHGERQRTAVREGCVLSPNDSIVDLAKFVDELVDSSRWRRPK